MQTPSTGLGDPQATFRVYVAKHPPMQEYADLTAVQPLCRGEIDSINAACGNGWRKLFNVYAKLLFALDSQHFTFSQQASSWQQYRDQHLLQQSSNNALLFSPPELNPAKKTIHIIAGRTHAKHLLSQGLTAQLNWLNDEFAMDQRNRLLVCPYFDYRQLNNEKIVRLCELIKGLHD